LATANRPGTGRWAMIEKERVRNLNDRSVQAGRYVVYWMQASQRAEYNHALEFAVRQANALDKPLLVVFGITDRFPDANERHYFFMLEGLREVRASLEAKGIGLIIRHEEPPTVATESAGEACLVVVDRGYLRIQKRWRRAVARRITCPLVEVESDVVVPVELTSSREEYAAATIRPKIKRQLESHLLPFRHTRPKHSSLKMGFDTFDITDVGSAVARLSIDRSVAKSSFFRGGTSQAKRHLREFLRGRLDHFDDFRNDPSRDYLSNMSPYLHFGQISPLYIAQQVTGAGGKGAEAYLEELIVRRELSMNFVYYNPQYDSFDCLPDWAKRTLRQHRQDRREYIYTLKQLEAAGTHDPYWNAAQNEMRVTGKMHGYMRMYWGKKILEWTERPDDAFRIALHLNNKYEIDGRDANGFAGVAWCFGKHDRPWAERSIFGRVRYMNDKGLKRKFDIDAYVTKVDRLLGYHQAGRAP
jgi:deoxyribodipyrimidine photo-lyase